MFNVTLLNVSYTCMDIVSNSINAVGALTHHEYLHAVGLVYKMFAYAYFHYTIINLFSGLFVLYAIRANSLHFICFWC